MVSPSRRSWFRRCHRGVAFIIALSWCCYCCHVIAVPSLLHCHGFVIPVAVSPLSLHCCGFVIAVAVSPLCQSQFRHCHCGVAFTSVTVSSLPSWYCLHHRIIMVSSSQLCCCGAFTVTLLWFCCQHHGVTFIVTLSPFCHRHRGVTFTSVTVSSSPSWCRLHVGRSFVIAIVVSPSCQLRFHHCQWCRLCHCIVTVLLLQSCYCGAFAVALLQFHCCHCGVAFVVAVAVLPSSLPSRCCLHHCRHGVAFIIASLWFHRCCSVAFIVALSRCHCHGFIVAIVVLPLRWSQFHCCHCGVAFIVASSQCHHHSHIVVVPSLSHHCGFVIAIMVSPSLLHHYGVVITIL